MVTGHNTTGPDARGTQSVLSLSDQDRRSRRGRREFEFISKLSPDKRRRFSKGIQRAVCLYPSKRERFDSSLRWNIRAGFQVRTPIESQLQCVGAFAPAIRFEREIEAVQKT
jgi:hypothetical protein